MPITQKEKKLYNLKNDLAKIKNYEIVNQERYIESCRKQVSKNLIKLKESTKKLKTNQKSKNIGKITNLRSDIVQSKADLKYDEKELLKEIKKLNKLIQNKYYLEYQIEQLEKEIKKGD